MSVRVAYFDGRTEGLGSFTDDLIAAIDRACAAGDGRAADRLRGFVLEYVERRLAAKTAKQLDRYLGTRAVWKRTRYWNVYRVPDTPSMSFAAKIGTGDDILLVPVGACYRYPEDDPEAWWRMVIEPRVGSLT